MKLIFVFATVAAYGQLSLPPQLQGIGIEQHLGAQIPLNTQFVDQTGAPVVLRSLFTSRPVVLALVYYECPMLCNQILSGVVAGLRPLALKAGRDFDVIAISINPNETAQEADEKLSGYAQRYGSSTGWHFLTGTDASIRAVADSVGFHYRYDPRTKLYIHASGILTATPDGRVSRYLYGVTYTPKDLKLALMESANHRIGSPVDQILLFCYHYDPATGKYGAMAMRALRISSLIVLCVLTFGLVVLWRKEFRDGRRFAKEGPPR